MWTSHPKDWAMELGAWSLEPFRPKTEWPILQFRLTMIQLPVWYVLPLIWLREILLVTLARFRDTDGDTISGPAPPLSPSPSILVRPSSLIDSEFFFLFAYYLGTTRHAQIRRGESSAAICAHPQTYFLLGKYREESSRNRSKRRTCVSKTFSTRL